MKINDYYQDVAQLNLNGSIAALLPNVFLIAFNLALFHNHKIFILAVPFFLYSFFCFQLYLFRKQQALRINRNMTELRLERKNNSLLSARYLLVLYSNSQNSRVLFYYPDGHLAGSIKRYRSTGLRPIRFSKIYVLYDEDHGAIACYRVKGKKTMKIEVYDKDKSYLGCLLKTKQNWWNNREELFNGEGKYFGEVAGSKLFMDEKIIDSNDRQVSRLRRGWMPVEWSPIFPEPNTPVLSFSGNQSAQEKLLGMTILINEYFLER
ncbi:hypothetical protein JK635_17005 [Neobacillus sp. YIM B02564]|uniref:Uncharacterized protein n=1 Tax=Neobacillus paridis TaxID=2803862 RepID=A0ABS1TRE1_9BACI|nr:hypothetical protein [Neobacillus paridis]MBL4953886.1 hypothetical protein [Neobacillus paridis]